MFQTCKLQQKLSSYVKIKKIITMHQFKLTITDGANYFLRKDEEGFTHANSAAIPE